jgi:hypothetical protein
MYLRVEHVLSLCKALDCIPRRRGKNIASIYTALLLKVDNSFLSSLASPEKPSKV